MSPAQRVLGPAAAAALHADLAAVAAHVPVPAAAPSGLLCCYLHVLQLCPALHWLLQCRTAPAQHEPVMVQGWLPEGLPSVRRCSAPIAVAAVAGMPAVDAPAAAAVAAVAAAGHSQKVGQTILLVAATRQAVGHSPWVLRCPGDRLGTLTCAGF